MMQLIKNMNPDPSIRNAITLLKAALAFDMPIVMTSSQEDHVPGPRHPLDGLRQTPLPKE